MDVIKKSTKHMRMQCMDFLQLLKQDRWTLYEALQSARTYIVQCNVQATLPPNGTSPSGAGGPSAGMRCSDDGWMARLEVGEARDGF